MDAIRTIASDPLALREVAGPRPAQTADVAEARRVGEEFEAMFLSKMLAPMFAGLRSDGPFGGGHGETMFRSLMIDEYGKRIAKAGGVGIADAVAREMLRLQENGHGQQQ
jgi:Rod binding domain-containing protein